MAMMTKMMLNHMMSIGTRGKGELSQMPIPLVFFVAEFMRDIDCHAVDGTDRQ